MHVIGQQKTSKAFALPTVLIASIVLLMVLAVSVTATAAVRTALKNQYYIQLAQVAGESGVAYAKACLAANGNIPQWTDAKPLTPATDCSGNLILSPTVKALIVAGGGSGGGSTGGGGGAGGVIYDDSVTIAATSYPVSVGAGGAIPGNQKHGLSGNNSSFNGISATGGGGGGYSAGSTSGAGGYNGGSGGGGENYYSSYTSGTGIGGQGNAGGPLGTAAASGGGGAGGAGTAGSGANMGGDGGPGVQYNITGSMVYYGAGGGGANQGVAGAGGNMTPGPGNGQAPSASANTGNGGTGGWAYADGNGGAGGSGVVVLSYPIDSGIIATGGTITTSGGNKIHKFTSSGTFTVTSTGSASCPTDPKCSVTVNGNIRSSFSVPKPTVDSNGQALTIPNSGYVDVLRTSNGGVWRTYKQPSVQAAVVPDLCSGNATAARGWSSAVKTTQQDALPSASTAQTISIADSAINGGILYFRKDFNISLPGSYDFNLYTSTAQDIAATYIDGQLISTTAGSNSTVSTSLTAGCHVMIVELTNATVVQRASHFTAALTRNSAAVPVLVTDSSWRVTTGDPMHFSTNNYYESPGGWESAAVRGAWNDPALPWSGNPATASWANVSGDTYTQWISTQANSNGTAAPANGTALFRDTQPFTLNTADTVRISTFCDDFCDLYLDGNLITSGNYSLISKSITIQPGTHTFGMRLTNGAAGASGFLFSAYDITSNTVVSRTSVDWDATTSWSPSAIDSYSFDASYTPVPAVQPTTNIKVLLVAGGGSGGTSTGGSGGGGGGGAGGMLYNAAYSIGVGSYSVTVGAGGAAVSSASTIGNPGQNSLFNDLRAFGGGGGGASNGRSSAGGSGGGAGYLGYTFQAGSPGVGGQGNNGGSTLSNNNAGGGGGAGGAGGDTNSGGPSGSGGVGGLGLANSITGSSVTYARGGDGGGPPGGFYNGAANTGNGGSGVYATTSSGAGGSGVVIIAVPIGSMSVTAPGATVTTASGYTVYRFNASSVFTINSIL